MKRVAETMKNSSPVFEYDNLKWPPFPGIYPNPEKKFRDIMEMECRYSDVFLCSFPKSGTHWLFEVISMLIRQSAEYNLISLPDSCIETYENKELLKELDSPRLIVTHLPYTYLPIQLREGVGKILYIQRNPKDLHVSLYNFQKGKAHIIKQMSFGQFLEVTAFGKEARFGGWFNYTLEWENHFDRKQILPVYYEDMKQDLEGEILKIAKFLEIRCSKQFAWAISDKCTFDKMQQNKDDYIQLLNNKGDSTPLYRKG